MADYLSPLEAINPVRIIAHIWQDENVSQSEKLRRIKEILKHTRRSLMQVLHPDVSGVSDEELTQRINEAFRTLGNDALLPVILDRFFDPNELRQQQSLNDALRDVRATQQRAAVLMQFLSVVDWRTIVGSSVPQEILFGLPAELHDPGYPYYHTFLLRYEQETQRLMELVHPSVDYSEWPKGFAEPPVWEKGRWLVRQHESRDVEPAEGESLDNVAMPAPKLYVYNYIQQNDLGPATLVGGVSEKNLRRLSAGLSLPTMRGATGTLVSSVGTTALTNLIWETPSACWWLPGLTPRLNGNLAVIAKGTGDNLRLAIVGFVVANRSLV